MEVSFIKKRVGNTDNYYFTPNQEITLWNAYIFDVLPEKNSIVVSFKKDTNFLLYRLLEKKGDELLRVIGVEGDDKSKIKLFTESSNYFYIKIWVPPKQMYYLRKAKGDTLKEAIINVNNIWENSTKRGFHMSVKIFKLTEF